MEKSIDFTKPEEYRLYVTNLPVELNEEGIKQIFDHYGKIIGLFYRPNTTWTFITYRTYCEAEYALRDLHDKPPLYLKVSFSKEKASAEIREEESRNTKSAELYEHPIQDSLYDSKPHIQMINSRSTFYKNKLKSRLPAPEYTSDDLLYPVPTDPYTYNPYESEESYDKNVLWTRGTVTVTRDGKRHVSHGRGYTSYEIPDPHPKIETLINQIHEKRSNGLYEHGQDVLKHRIGKCILCNRLANLKCKKCLSFYCSKECQITDWPRHKSECQKMPELIKDTESLSSSSNEGNVPVSHFQQMQKTLRRPKQTVESLLYKHAEKTTNKNINVTNTESSKKENFQNNYQTDDTAKISNDISKLTTIEKDDTNKTEKVDSSDALEIEKDLAFKKKCKPFLTSYYQHVKVTNIEEKGVYWVTKSVDTQALKNIESELSNAANKMPKAEPVVGLIYAYKFNMLWHRVRVISLNPTKIFFIDSGITMIVEDNNFYLTKLHHLPPYAGKISLSSNSAEFAKIIQVNNIVIVKAIKYTEDIVTVDVKHIQNSKNKLNKSEAIKIYSPMPNVLLTLLDNAQGILNVQTVIHNNVYGVTLIPHMFHGTGKALKELSYLCEQLEPIDNDKTSVGQLVCAKGTDENWFRGCVLSLQPIRLAMVDKARVVTSNKIVAIPDKYLHMHRLGVICEVTTNDVKLKVDKSYDFTVIHCIDKIKIEIITSDKNKVNAFLQSWEPRPEQSGIKLYELKNGSEVCITAYHSPSILYVRSLQMEDIENFHKIMQEIAKCAQSAPCLEKLPPVGEMVLAQYTDDNFYRAIVTKVQGEEIKISYVDYGNGETLGLNKLRVLPANLKLHPSCAAKITLKDVPSDATMTKDLTDYFVCLTGREIPVICNFSGIPSEDGVLLTAANGESINDKIKQMLIPSWEKDNKKDETVYMITDMKSAKLEDSNETRAIVLSTVEEGVKYILCPLDIDLITNVYDVLPGLMNEYCEKTEYYIPRRNELCLALYDGNWYRGLCIDTVSHTDKCHIFFLDYGNMEYILHKNIRAMTKDFLTPAFLGNICTVVNLVPKDEDGNINPRVLKRISQLIAIENVLIKIVKTEQEGFYEIELPEIRTQLIEEGLI